MPNEKGKAASGQEAHGDVLAIDSWRSIESEIRYIAEANPTNIQQVAASQLALINSYYESVLKQAQRSFLLALAAAIVGSIFFVVAIFSLLLQQPEKLAEISLISGALVEFISAVNFYLYGRTSKQLESFHVRLDRTQRFLLANSVCCTLADDARASSGAELVRIIANASATVTNENEENKRNIAAKKGDKTSKEKKPEK